MITRLKRYFGQRAVGLYDQALHSFGSLIQLIALAQALSVESFGLTSIFLSLAIFASSAHRSAVFLPQVLDITINEDKNTLAWKKIALFFAIIIPLFYVSAGLLVYNLNFYSIIFLSFGVFCFMMYEYARKNYFLNNKEKRSLLLSSTYFASSVVLSAYIVITPPGLDATLIGITASYAFPFAFSIVLTYRENHVSSCAWQVLRDNYRRSIWNILSLAPYSVYNTLSIFFIGLSFGLREAGTVAATRIFLAPLTTALTSFDAVEKARASRALRQGGVKELSAFIKNSLLLGISLSTLYAIVCFFFFLFASKYIFGSKYDGGEYYLIAWLSVGILMSAGQILETGLLMLDRQAVIFVNRLVSAFVFLFFAFIYTAGSIGNAGIVFSWTASSILALGAYFRASPKVTP